MVEAMDSIENYEYVAVFDADFDPDSDFLFNTRMENEDAGFVQTRWTFTNAKETVLTRVQETLSYHMLCEQYAMRRGGYSLTLTAPPFGEESVFGTFARPSRIWI